MTFHFDYICHEQIFLDMKENRLIETFGYIKKVDQLETLESNVLKNTFVLESPKPYPGYHGSNLPSESIPLLYFRSINDFIYFI